MREILQSERLLLRPIVDTDASRIAYLAGDYDVAKMTARIPHPYPVIAVEGWIMLQAAARRLGRDYPFAIVRPGHGLIGTCGVSVRDDVGLAAWEIGYWLGKPYWGEGYATEAARCVMDWARADLGVEVFTAGHYSENPASGHVLEKLGFVHTGSAEAYAVARRGSARCERYVWPDGVEVDNVDPHASGVRVH